MIRMDRLRAKIINMQMNRKDMMTIFKVRTNNTNTIFLASLISLGIDALMAKNVIDFHRINVLQVKSTEDIGIEYFIFIYIKNISLPYFILSV